MSDAAAQHYFLDGQAPADVQSKPLREMTLAEVIRESNADPRRTLRHPTRGAHRRPHPARPHPRPRRAQRHDRADHPPRQCATRTALHPLQSAGRLRALSRRDVSLPRLQGRRHPLRRGSYDRVSTRADVCVEPQLPLRRFHHLLKTFWADPAAGGTGNYPTAPSSGPHRKGMNTASHAPAPSRAKR